MEGRPARLPIRVLIIDDSALVRSLLTRILSEDAELEVIGTAPDAFAAREQIKRLQPDVLTLDVQMPGMDGLQFLRNLMRLRPMPVVMCSSLTRKGAEVTLAALELGAVDFIAKPQIDLAHGLTAYAGELIEKVKTAARARVRALSDLKAQSFATDGLAPDRPGVGAASGTAAHVAAAAIAAGQRCARERAIAIGASTGGTEAVREVLSLLPRELPGVLIAQHIPRAFSAQFAARLNACSALSVQEAQDGALIRSGCAYVAPGDRHLTVVRDGALCRCRLDDRPALNRHRPSVDLLFESMAEQLGPQGAGVILTGMGADGAQGLRKMRERGARTIAQDEPSSVVWGMSGAAVALGAAGWVLPLAQIADALAHAESVGSADRGADLDASVGPQAAARASGLPRWRGR